MSGTADIPDAPAAAQAPGRARSRTRRRVLLPLAAGAVLAVVGPALVAGHYAPPGEGWTAHLRPDEGWRVIVDGVRLSRDARLGSGGSAEERAREVWAGPPARAESVELVHAGGTFRVVLPDAGGVRREVAIRPRSALTWLVRGDAVGRRDVPIGALDYRSGTIVWDARALLRRPAPPS